MKTKCPHCGEEYEVESDDLGRTAECSTCGGEFQVSDADASPEIKIAIPLSNDAFAESVREEASSSSESPSAGTKTCPFCFSAVPLEARKCASCGEWIPECKPKDPLPYIILLLLFGNLGFHDFYAEQSSRGCVKLGLFLFGLIVLCVSGQAAIFIFILCINSFWCVVDLCGYRENLRPHNRTGCATVDQANDRNKPDPERESQESIIHFQ